jgi:hypothetical protein
LDDSRDVRISEKSPNPVFGSLLVSASSPIHLAYRTAGLLFEAAPPFGVYFGLRNCGGLCGSVSGCLFTAGAGASAMLEEAVAAPAVNAVTVTTCATVMRGGAVYRPVEEIRPEKGT